MKYSAINIGPIVKTLGLARKPRELWAASFLFSDLMNYIIKEMPGYLEVLSPARLLTSSAPGLGLYPDRIYVRGEIADDDFQNLVETAWEKFGHDVFSDKDVRRYFTLMTASVEVDADHKAIKELNALLDVLELNVTAADTVSTEEVLALIQKTSDSPLFVHGLGIKSFPVDSLQEIARVSSGDGRVRKSYHNYICVVQADGDNVGTYLSGNALKDGELAKVSEALLSFGIKASDVIKDFGGMPVYAGGDDLLFIAPVVGKDGRSDIFDLLTALESAFSGVSDLIADASLSFGVSMTYYKHPLYESLQAARKLLFEKAKKVPGKNAVAWILQKHSGEQFAAAFSKKTPHLWDEFANLLANTTDGNTVSAVAHKLREFAPLVERVVKSNVPSRLDSLFDKVLEMKNNGFFKAVKSLMPILNGACPDGYVDTLYALLRTAKFVKGEEPIDE